jgi:DNA repair protein RadC
MSFRIHDLPQNDRPRERLLRLGAASLSNAELLALFINTGLPGQSAIAIAQKLLQEHGTLTALSRRDAAELAKERGLGPAKTALISAAFELGRRAASESMDQMKMDTPEQIYAYFGSELSALSQESVRVLLLNTKLCLIKQQEIFRGSVNECMAHPREILQPAIAHAAHAFILVHNHPSGDPTPSDADRRITKRIREAAGIMQITFLDHIIIGRPSEGRLAHFSFRAAGMI